MIECMRTVARKPEFGTWVPVTERLPEDFDMRFYMCIVENTKKIYLCFANMKRGVGLAFGATFTMEKR